MIPIIHKISYMFLCDDLNAKREFMIIITISGPDYELCNRPTVHLVSALI